MHLCPPRVGSRIWVPGGYAHPSGFDGDGAAGRRGSAHQGSPTDRLAADRRHVYGFAIPVAHFDCAYA